MDIPEINMGNMEDMRRYLRKMQEEVRAQTQFVNVLMQERQEQERHEAMDRMKSIAMENREEEEERPARSWNLRCRNPFAS